MVPTLIQMEAWSTKTEEELTLLLKEWLKQQGKTQADLRRSLNAESARMSALLEVLKKEYLSGGIPKLANLLCKIEKYWSQNIIRKDEINTSIDTFGQLDLLLQTIREDCEKKN